MKDKEIKFIEMKQKDIKPLKEKIWEKNSKKCPILNKEIPLDKMVLDHAHKRKDEEYQPDKGVARGSIDFRVNVILGKIENSVKRVGLNYEEGFNLPEMLRNMADFLEKGAYNENGTYYVHPKEVKKEPPVSKKNYNKLKKEYEASGKKKKFPEYPASKKCTVELRKLFEEFNISPFN